MKYDMVFEGGGAKGMVFVGALQELERRKHTPARLMGSSAGAIMATFLAAGYSAGEMLAALSEEKAGEPVFKGFLENPPQFTPEQLKRNAFRELLRNMNSVLLPDLLEDKLDDAFVVGLSKFPLTNQMLFFFEYGGFFAGQYFLDWLEHKLNAGVYPGGQGSFAKDAPRQFGGLTLKSFYEATGVDLTLIASDTTDARLLALNHRTAPDCPVIYAVRMSMSFPLLWQEVVWEEGWGLYRGRNITGHAVVDGGMLSNLPIELFIANEPYITAVMGEKTVGADRLLGFLIDESMEVPGAAPQPGPVGMKRESSLSQLRTVQRIGRLIDTMTQAHDKMVIEQYERFVVHLPAKGYGTTEFNMSAERRNALVSAGQEAASLYFDTHHISAAHSMGLEAQPKTPVVPEPFFDQANRLARHILDF